MNSSSINATLRATAMAALVGLCSGGCYVLQSAVGQLDLMARRKPIGQVVDSPATPSTLRAALDSAAKIREFASRELGLPDNGSYRSYADVGRPYVVWNVVAAPEFSVDAKQWCYPIAGCVAYRGYFVERRARRFAARQRALGFDVTVGGVAAYSTLGHFDDPVLNTMMGWDDVELAAIIFHELTHQLLYVANDSSFNESLAATVEEEGVRRWLSAQGRDRDLQRHLQHRQRYSEVIELLRKARNELRVVYAARVPPAQMRAHKQATFDALRSSYGSLRARWSAIALPGADVQSGAVMPLDGWFDEEQNNARLAAIATYTSCVPGFERELAAVNGDLPAFYRRVQQLAKLDQATRDASVCGDA